MKYIMKQRPVVDVTGIVENTYDEEGNKTSGRVTYVNEYGATCVKTYDQFFDKYEEKQ